MLLAQPGRASSWPGGDITDDWRAHASRSLQRCTSTPSRWATPEGTSGPPPIMAGSFSFVLLRRRVDTVCRPQCLWSSLRPGVDITMPSHTSAAQGSEVLSALKIEAHTGLVKVGQVPPYTSSLPLQRTTTTSSDDGA